MYFPFFSRRQVHLNLIYYLLVFLSLWCKINLINIKVSEKKKEKKHSILSVILFPGWCKHSPVIRSGESILSLLHQNLRASPCARMMPGAGVLEGGFSWGVPTPIQTRGAFGVLSVASISLLWLNITDTGCAVRTCTSKASRGVGWELYGLSLHAA